MIRPPVNRTMRQLDRSFFSRDYPISAARVYESRNISRIRNSLSKSKDLLRLRLVPTVVSDPSPVDGKGCGSNRRCLLLNENVKFDAQDPKTWSSTLMQLSQENEIALIPYQLHLDYSNWSAHEILKALLPEELEEDLPTGYNPVGHVAHFNLRDKHLPYKTVIAEVTIDKNSAIETVINKVDTLGADNEFRVLEYELLAGRPDLDVEVVEAGSRYQFDFSKVFWNSRLGTEHARLVEQFQPGEVICDVMAGVGPFAIPAGRKGVFVWANDLNPDCYLGLERAIALNKVQPFVQGFCEDGHTFIKSAASRLLNEEYIAKVPIKVPRTERAKGTPTHIEVHRPRTFGHFVMNLPASAPEFLPDFAGLYEGHETLFEPHTATKLPMIHCYCFGPKEDEVTDDSAAKRLVCQQTSEKIGATVSLDTPDTEIIDVRDVAPNKRQFCVSFRLPTEVAFRKCNGPK